MTAKKGTAAAPKAASTSTTRTAGAPAPAGNVTRLKAWPKSVKPAKGGS